MQLPFAPHIFYVYCLKSKINGDLYVGFSADLKKRFQEHSKGEVKATKGYRPWELVYYEAYKSKSDARRREIQLKGHKAKSDLRKQIQISFEE